MEQPKIETSCENKFFESNGKGQSSKTEEDKIDVSGARKRKLSHPIKIHQSDDLVK